MTEMKAFTTIQVKGTEYKLKLTIGEIERLERLYSNGSLLNPLMQTQNGSLPSTVYIIDVLHGALQKFNHGMSRDEASKLFGDWIEEGNSITEAMKIITDIFQVSGFFPKQKEER
ncbi:DUF6096 family protein [Helcococcus bovis]|uniref:DUF6096 family protein n=1 Tax=Helcococcus bovis TaxID=3153252 RepID=UPI0038B6E2F1